MSNLQEALTEARNALYGDSWDAEHDALHSLVELFESPLLTVPDKQDRTVSYFLWTDGYAVGFKVTREDDKVEYIYLNPSNNDDGSDDPNVFVYSGEHGDPANDIPWHHYVQDFGEEK